MNETEQIELVSVDPIEVEPVEDPPIADEAPAVPRPGPGQLDIYGQEVQ